MSGPHLADVHLATTPEAIARCFNVMRELRTALTSPEEFVALIQQQQVEGFQLAFLEHHKQVVTVAGFRVQHMLATGLTMYVDDLVTGDAFRSQGHGKAMLDWLIARAHNQGCHTFSLDSGTQRREAHAFYFRENMRISSFHFMLPLG
ncbi:MAG: GNAT family N-acetyltransferase [Acidobacteriaceae bacterium]